MALDIRCSTDKIKTASPTFVADKSSGDWLQLENFVGVVVNDVAYATQADNPLIYEADDIVAPKATGTAWVAGDTLYFDTSALTFTPTYAAGLVKSGVALEDVASAGTSGRIHLRGALGLNFSGNREVWFPCGDGTNGGWVLDGTNPAAAATLGTNGQALAKVLNFDASSGDTDDEAFLNMLIPTDYQVDSASLILVWAHTDADNGADEALVWDGDVNAVEPGAATAEAFDAAGTAMAAVSVDVAAASAGKVYKTTLDIEVLAIAAGDLVTVHLWVDASACEIDATEHVQLIGAYLQYEAAW